MKPLLHTYTETLLERYQVKPTHGLILSGEDGIGKYYVATWLAGVRNLNLYTLSAEDGKTAITIEQIRNLYNLTRTGGSLLIVIKDAHQLTREAQNAFLKLLEEPPRNTWFVLTTSSPTKLLETIRSRCQTIRIAKPSRAELLRYLETVDLDVADSASLIQTTQGLPGKTMQVVASTDAKTAHAASVDAAKEFYGASSYRRHIMCIEHSYDKDWIQSLLDLLVIIVQTLMKLHSANVRSLAKLKAQATLLEETSQRIFTVNGNPKIHLARLSELL